MTSRRQGSRRTQTPHPVGDLGCHRGSRKNCPDIPFPPSPHGTGLTARQVRLDLNVNELGARDVAAQDVGVGCIAEVIAPAAQFSGDEELARIASENLVSRHG